MTYPDFIERLPALDIPFPEATVKARAIRSDAGLAVFFSFAGELVLPEHAHKAQWGIVVEGEIEFTFGGETKVYRPGDSYSIGAGVPHGAVIRAGTKVIDVFEEPDRYPFKG
jgi:quercetin dioxygenase-like cupin family protein